MLYWSTAIAYFRMLTVKICIYGQAYAFGCAGCAYIGLLLINLFLLSRRLQLEHLEEVKHKKSLPQEPANSEFLPALKRRRVMDALEALSDVDDSDSDQSGSADDLLNWRAKIL